MNVLRRYIFSLLFLLSFFVTFLGGTNATAQTAQSVQATQCDSIYFYQEEGVIPATSWRYKVFNKGNTDCFHQINKITIDIDPGQGDPGKSLTFDSLGPAYIEAPAVNKQWLFLPVNGYTRILDSVDMSNGGGSPIARGFGDSVFGIVFNENALQRNVCITWRTWFNNTQWAIGQHCMFSRYDNFSPHDIVTGSASVLPNCDASFNLTVQCRNRLGQRIDGLRVHLNDAGNGSALTMRPSAIKAPNGWYVDSVTTSDAYFHAFNTDFGIQYGQTLSGFIVTARGAPFVHNYALEWTAYNAEDPQNPKSPLNHIDYDTLDSLRATPGPCTVEGSSDTLVANKIGATCAYNVTTENFHVDSTTSRITRVTLVSKSPGVTFSTAPNAPPGWGLYFGGTNKDSLYFVAFDSSYSLASGTRNTFTVVVDNANPQTPFTMDWATFDSKGLVSKGTLPFQCEAPKIDSDDVVFVPISNCVYIDSVLNKHNPVQTRDKYVTFVIHPDSKAKFNTSRKPGSNLKWAYQFTTDTMLQFRAPDSAREMQPFQYQIDTFQIKPFADSVPVPIQWYVQDTAGRIVGIGWDTLRCIPPQPQCDSVYFGHSNCRDSITIKNTRLLAEGDITKIDVIPQNGWLVDSASVPVPLTKTFNTDGTLTINGNLKNGVPRGGIIVKYKPGNNSPTTFDVKILTYANLSPHICTHYDYSVVGVDCVPPDKGVVIDGKYQVESIALAAYPNPFSGHTEISFALPEREYVDLTMIDVMGRVVNTTLHGMQEQGEHTTAIDAAQLAPGTYYLRLETPYSRVTKKLVIQR